MMVNMVSYSNVHRHFTPAYESFKEFGDFLLTNYKVKTTVGEEEELRYCVNDIICIPVESFLRIVKKIRRCSILLMYVCTYVYISFNSMGPPWGAQNHAFTQVFHTNHAKKLPEIHVHAKFIQSR